MKVRWGVAMAALAWMAGNSFGDIVFSDSFENQPYADSGNPQGWSIFGAPLDDRGVLNNTDFHSPTAAVWVAVTWSGWGWGATTVSNEGVRYDVLNNNASLSAWFRSTADFTAGSIAFTIFDADGTQLRMDGTNMIMPGTTWTHYEAPVNAMVTETAGNVPGLDVSNVTHFGFLAFTSGQTGQNQLQFDDFTVQSIPEPATGAFLALGLGAWMWCRKRNG